MFALVDGQYKFRWVDVGTAESCSDAQIFVTYIGHYISTLYITYIRHHISALFNLSFMFIHCHKR